MELRARRQASVDLWPSRFARGFQLRVLMAERDDQDGLELRTTDINPPPAAYSIPVANIIAAACESLIHAHPPWRPHSPRPNHQRPRNMRAVSTAQERRKTC